MKRKFMMSFLFGLLAFPLLAQTTEIEGTVKDDQGNPMPDVKVFFEHSIIAGIKSHVTTNKKGEFYYPGLLYQEPGTWKIYPEVEGYLVKHLRVESRDSRRELFTDIDSDLNGHQVFPEVICKPGGKVKINFILVPRSYFEQQSAESQSIGIVDIEAPSTSSINKARELYAQGHIEEALDIYRKTIAEGHDESICVETGKILLELGRYDEAMTFLKKALSLKPNLPMVHYALAHIYRKKGNNVAALEELKKELDISPDQIKVWKNMGELLVELGRDREALQVYERIVEKTPEYVKAYFALGSLYSRMGDYQKSEQAFRKVVELNPSHADKSYYNIGVSIINKEELTPADRERAKEAFSKAIEINPNYAEAHLQLGYLLLSDGKMQEAKNHFKKYLELKPDSSEAKTVKSFIESL